MNMNMAERAMEQAIEQEREESPFKPSSVFNPQMPWDTINVYSEAMTNDLLSFRMKQTNAVHAGNITPAERKALQDLLRDPTVIIKPSDKGGNVVLLIRDQYRKEAIRQLSDEKYYQSTNNETYKHIAKLYDELVRKWYDRSMLGTEEHLFIHSNNPMIPTFYHLPKLHKDSQDPHGRPIVSSVNGLMEHMSMFIDNYLFPFVAQLQSYTKDTKDFLNKIANTSWDSTYLLMVLDITSLYTCIKHEYGMNAIRYYLEQWQLRFAQHNLMLLEFVEFCLTNNIFLFEDQFFRQVSGTAMGTCFAPSYANLFVGWWRSGCPGNIKGRTVEELYSGIGISMTCSLCGKRRWARLISISMF
ncbi:uncharacterized protein LOC144824927 [Lissotriton helveticus]